MEMRRTSLGSTLVHWVLSTKAFGGHHLSDALGSQESTKQKKEANKMQTFLVTSLNF